MRSTGVGIPPGRRETFGERGVVKGRARAAGAALALLALGCAPGSHDPAGGGFRIGLEGSRISVSGLSSCEATALSENPPSLEAWPLLLAVRVKTAGPEGLPLFGDYRVEGTRLVFEPRYPLRAGLTYLAVFDPSRLTAGGRGSPARVEREFAIPAAPAGPPTVLRAVFPTTDHVPENLLKFYLHFSAPMSRGGAYRFIHLLGPEGREVELPFLELGEELWNGSGTRLTLLFDPGRIKQGLKPREESGPSLQAGKTYTLVIDPEWPDAGGRPLGGGTRKTFSVGPPDATCPDPSSWKWVLPRAGTREPLRVLLGKPLDEALLRRVLTVQSPLAEPLPGTVEVDQEETRWSFIPDQPWPRGRHRLRVETTLEDLAGNSLERPFEVDVSRPLERSLGSKTVDLPFEVRAEPKDR
jgi:hypothetical protein